MELLIFVIFILIGYIMWRLLDEEESQSRWWKLMDNYEERIFEYVFQKIKEEEIVLLSKNSNEFHKGKFRIYISGYDSVDVKIHGHCLEIQGCFIHNRRMGELIRLFQDQRRNLVVAFHENQLKKLAETLGIA